MRELLLGGSIAIAGLSYLLIYPAPSNSPSPYVISKLQTEVRFWSTIGQFLRLWNPELEIEIARSFTKPSPCVENVKEQVIERTNYKLYIFTPNGYEGDRGAIINFHGGGWVIGNVPGTRRYYSTMARDTGSIIIAPDYRLAPEHVYPAQIDDCIEATKYVFDNAEDLGVNKNKIVLTGDSAGGHLALVVALELVETIYQLKAILPVYPVTQAVTTATKSYIEKDAYFQSRKQMAWFFSLWIFGTAGKEGYWLNNDIKHAAAQDKMVGKTLGLDNYDYETLKSSEEFELLVKTVINSKVSPLLAPKELLKKLPYVTIYISEHDVLKDDGILMYDRLIDAGNSNRTKLVTWEGAIHVETILSKQAIGFDLVPQATRWVSEYMTVLKHFTE